jgi:glycosyltransferase involved in cell wall biosynthesis
MRVTIVRSMPNFSMDVYADGIVAGLSSVRPTWHITEVKPTAVNRRSRSLMLRGRKAYERFWAFPRQVQRQLIHSDIIHIVDHSEGHIARWLSDRSKSDSKSVVITCHDLINYFYRDNLQGSVRLPFISDGLWMASVRSMRQAAHIIAVSSETAKDINHLLNISHQNISVIPNAVESAFKSLNASAIAAARQGLGVTPETFCLLNLGSQKHRRDS